MFARSAFWRTPSCPLDPQPASKDCTAGVSGATVGGQLRQTAERANVFRRWCEESMSLLITQAEEDGGFSHHFLF